MLALTSNIGQVLTRMTRIANTLQPNIATAFNPSLYQENVREGVRAILAEADVLSDNEKDSAIPILLDSIAIENGPIQNSLVISMGGINIWAASRESVALITQGDIALDTVKDWVDAGKEGRVGPDGERIGKEFDGRDLNKEGSLETTDEIAMRVFFAMKRDQDAFFGTQEPGRGALNPSGLAAFGSFTNIDPSANQARALMLVIDYLRQWVIDTFPESVLWRIRTVLES